MDPFLASPFPSIAQILNHKAPRQERLHSRVPLKLPGAQRLNYHRQHQCGSVASASIPPGQGLTQRKDEHHSLFSVHKHKKVHAQAMLPILPQPQPRLNGSYCCLALVPEISS
uniref:Phagocytosis and cell motility protein ELMO1 n=1 Tax=Rhizophora mucronata TaxID=61149 RepID=A0A2P2KWV6_RHIMU